MTPQEFQWLRPGQIVSDPRGIHYRITNRIDRFKAPPIYEAVKVTHDRHGSRVEKPENWTLVAPNPDPVVFQAFFDMPAPVVRSIPLTDNAVGQMIAVSETNESFTLSLFGVSPTPRLLTTLGGKRIKITIEVEG